MAVVNNKHQRLTGSGRGETSFCAAGHSCPPISAAYQFQSPFLPADHSRRGRILPRPRRASYSHSRAGLLPGRCDRRLVHTPLWAGRLPEILRSVDMALRSQVRVTKHKACKLSDASERHSIRLSWSKVQRPNRDTGKGPKSWKSQPIRTAQ